VTWKTTIAQFLAAGCGGISFLALLGHVFGVDELSRWGDPPMAVNTAIALMMAGGSMFLHQTDQHSAAREQAATTTPVILGKLCASDLVALVSIVGSFVVIAFGKADHVLGVLLAVTGYYFGRAARTEPKHAEGGKP
jgi:hypothetical protein